MNNRPLLVLAAALALGACNARAPNVSTPMPRYASLDGPFEARPTHPARRSGAPNPERRASPLVVLPGWLGHPTGLRERDDAEAFEQAIAFGPTPRGEARVLVTMRRSRAASDGLSGGAVRPMGKPTEAGIRAELDAAFPNVVMRVVPRPAANAYGPYGLAIGHGAAGLRCLYAWQWIEAPPDLDAGPDGDAPLSVRVRLCRSDITLEAMAAAVNQLRLVPRFAGQPVAASRIAPAKQPIAHRRRPRPVVSSSARPEPGAETTIDRTAARVQAQPDASGRRYLGADPALASSAPSVPVGASALRSTLAGLGSPMAPSGGITVDLPAEAYRGPVGAPAR